MPMKRFLLVLATLLAAALSLPAAAPAADPIDELLPVRGLAIQAPQRSQMNDFLKFVEGELVPAHFNRRSTCWATSPGRSRRMRSCANIPSSTRTLP